MKSNVITNLNNALYFCHYDNKLLRFRIRFVADLKRIR